MQISASMDMILQHISLQRFFFFFFKVTAIKFKNTHPAYMETLASANKIAFQLQTTTVCLLDAAYLLHMLEIGPCHTPSSECQVVKT